MSKIKSATHNPTDLVKHSNSMTTAKYDLSPLALKAFLLAYSKLTPQTKDLDLAYTFGLNDVARLLGDSAADPRNLFDALRRLQKESICIMEEDRYISHIPIPSLDIDGAKMTVTFYLNPRLNSHYLNMKQEYTLFPVEHAFRLSGKYSIRLYQLIMQWQGKAGKGVSWVVELDPAHLREIWMIQPNEYKLMAGFRRDVIERAITEINSAQLGILLALLPPKKYGKNITHFVIEARLVNQKEPRNLNPKPATPTEDADEKLIKKHPDLWAKILEDEMKQGDLFNPISPSIAEFEARSRALPIFREAVKKTKKVGKLGVEK